MADPTITGTGAVKRAEFKLFADVGEAESPEWELQGDRIEELSLELNPNVETVTDVTGVTISTSRRWTMRWYTTVSGRVMWWPLSTLMGENPKGVSRIPPLQWEAGW